MTYEICAGLFASNRPGNLSGDPTIRSCKKQRFSSGAPCRRTHRGTTRALTGFGHRTVFKGSSRKKAGFATQGKDALSYLRSVSKEKGSGAISLMEVNTNTGCRLKPDARSRSCVHEYKKGTNVAASLSPEKLFFGVLFLGTLKILTSLTASPNVWQVLLCV